jgi:hypothetical protein
MKYQIFSNIINKIEETNLRTNQIYSLGVDLTEVTDGLHSIISSLLGAYYGQAGLDWIDWWCYDKEFGKREDINAWDKDKNEICRNLFELWEEVEKNRSEGETYEEKAPMTKEEREQIIKNLFNQQ